MVKRKDYLEKLVALKEKQIIKVVTGVRRCGKSTLLSQFQEYLRDEGVPGDCIIALNFDDVVNEDLCEYRVLYDHIIKELTPGKMNYIFLDEVQEVPDFQKAVNSLFMLDNTDIYITGSNAHMLSGELATLLSGRYIEIHMLPFSFVEFHEMAKGEKRDDWNNYFQMGGFPYLTSFSDNAVGIDYLTGIYNTVLVKDVVSRNRITDVALLDSIVKFLFSNVGSLVSSKKIADSLTSYGRKTTSITVENYIRALKEAFLLYKVDRYDVKGKENLKSLSKYYIVDVGLRRLLLGNKNVDIGYLLENIVYLELLRRGYEVKIGKVGNLEIDFVAERWGDRCYYQVAATVLDSNTYDREIAPLKALDDNYPKHIISMDEIPMNDKGIKQVNIIDFLLAEK